MKRRSQFSLAVITAIVLLGVSISALAQESTPRTPTAVSETPHRGPVHYPSQPGTLFVPKSSLPQTPPTGHNFAANTNVEIYLPFGVTPDQLPPFAGYGYESRLRSLAFMA